MAVLCVVLSLAIELLGTAIRADINGVPEAVCVGLGGVDLEALSRILVVSVAFLGRAIAVERAVWVLDMSAAI